MADSSFLNTNNYSTSQDYPRAILDRFSFGSSVYFSSKFVSLLVASRKLALAGTFDTPSWAAGSLDIFRHVESCGGRFELEGLDNILKSEEPVVFISNHMSMLESMLFPGIIASKREVTFVVKESLVSHQLFGPVMRSRNPITVSREDPIADFKKVMTDGLENLQKGTSVVIFPQSQRMMNFDSKQFNTLGIKLAKKAKVKIVPVALKTDFWKNGKLLKDVAGINRKLPIHIKFGEPFSIEGPGKKEHQKVIDFITKNLEEWKN